MRTGTEQEWCASEFISADEARAWLAQRAQIEDVPPRMQAPARRTHVQWRGAQLTVGWITPRSHPFCGSCDRVRLDARGRLRRCLMDPNFLDLASILQRQGGHGAFQAFGDYMAGKRPPSPWRAAAP